MEPDTSHTATVASDSATVASDSADEDPFDFISQFHKLQARKKKEKENLKLRKLKKVEDFNNKLLNFDKNSILASIVDFDKSNISNETSTASSSRSAVKAVNIRRSSRRKLNNSVVNSTVTSTASSSGSAINGPRGRRQKLHNTSQTVNIPNTQENTTASTQENTTASTRQNRRRKQYDFSSSKIIGPVISIGDFDDGYDIPYTTSSTVKITNEDVMSMPEDDCSLIELNRTMNIKVYWRKMRTYCFPLRMFQSIESIFEHFAKLEDIEPSQVSLKLHKKVLQSTDTPQSINYKISDFIDGELEFYKSIHDKSINDGDEEPESEEEVKFRIKQKDVKHPMFIGLKKTEKMYVLFLKISEKLGLDIKSFSLLFDGDKIKWSDTIESLDLEGDECLELFEKNNVT